MTKQEKIRLATIVTLSLLSAGIFTIGLYLFHLKSKETSFWNYCLGRKEKNPIVVSTPTLLSIETKDPAPVRFRDSEDSVHFSEKLKGFAASIKKILLHSFTEKKILNNVSGGSHYFQNPAQKYFSDEMEKKPENKELIAQINKTAGLFITEDNFNILKDYFMARKKEDDVMGRYYESLCQKGGSETKGLEIFILNFLEKRYNVIYINGAWINTAPHTFNSIAQNTVEKGGVKNKEWLSTIGTDGDERDEKIYEKLLTIEEMSLSPLVLPKCTSVMIGTGYRPKIYKDRTVEPIDYKKDLEESIDCAFLCYPAAAEFRSGSTAHDDAQFILRCTTKSDEFQEFRKRKSYLQTQKGTAYLEAAKKIYGNHHEIEVSEQPSAETNGNYLKLNDDFSLNISAYKARTKNTLKQVLLSANQDMEKYQLGTVFQLKGLGLGAFAFSNADSNQKIETLYIECVKEVVDELRNKNALTYIKKINLINMPSFFSNKENKAETLYADSNPLYKDIITYTNMSATKRLATALDVGGTVFCGDSGSKIGNEANRGMTASSSDDPATMYSLLSPKILDPTQNECLRDAQCISILTSDGTKSVEEMILKTSPKKLTI